MNWNNPYLLLHEFFYAQLKWFIPTSNGTGKSLFISLNINGDFGRMCPGRSTTFGGQ